ncbi:MULTISPECIES: AI-2E family transporter [Tissierellales]|uniref:AI-2E family transporter n=1 Tax=Acidilutibacter cellobiosedens TaxID=2507161 RepID=A0A410QF26_9FIRM|nr:MULTISPECIES: AI-2E family transporter [Tissierellales]MBE6082648.1 AI-2E family transporter [Tissierellaceae bacterium]QAT62525.1 AI-2E family transporter [Acidilutibacter cellobiosedens]SCL94329.1 pheromone autoinducer 2 transporter [Sporanaerobacter sp. PP17-6a]
MKINWNRNYTTISVYSFIVICCSIIFYLIISRISSLRVHVSNAVSVLQPFIIGLTIGYLLNFILKFYEKKVLTLGTLNKLKQKNKRRIGILLTYVTTLLMLYLFMNFILPQLSASIVGLINNIPYYIDKGDELLNNLVSRLNIREEYLDFAVEKWNEFVNYINNVSDDLVPMLGNLFKTAISGIWNIILGLIISIYVLIDKERFFALGKKIVYSLFSKTGAMEILKLFYRSNNIFNRFIGGKILDAFIIGIITFIVLTIFKMPYAVLISFTVGITNVIPFFGPFLGAIPSFIIIFFVSPIKALWFLLIILIIQQTDANLIEPKILGDSLGISAFWILFSILVMGKAFGIVGMIIGVPLFTIIYSIIKDIIEERLKKKDMPTETSHYL